MDETRTGHLKTGAVFPLFMIGVAILIGRLYMIQVIEHEDLVALGRKQSETTIALSAARGAIYDRQRIPLALSIKIPAVYADPGVAVIPEKARVWLPDVLGVSAAEFKRFISGDRELLEAVNDPTLERLRMLTGRLAAHTRADEGQYRARLDAVIEARRAEVAELLGPVLGVAAADVHRQLSRNDRFVWLRRPVDESAAAQVRRLDLRGVCVLDEPTRVATRGYFIGPWLGFVGAEGHGMEGLERYFDRELLGKAGVAHLEKDGRGKGIADAAEPTTPPVDGRNLHLTIDSRIQLIVDEEVRRLYSEYSPVSVSALVMDPYTGRILSLGSAPGFDPSMTRTIPSRQLTLCERNHPVQSVYEPGSTFKPLVVAACLDLGLVTPETRIFCENGALTYRGRTIHDTHSHGWLTVTDVVAYSSNPGAVKLGLMLGDARLRAYVLAYNFGQRLSIELPAEEPGLVTPARRWTWMTTTSVPIGQEIALTPLQLINSFCCLINGGYLMRPYLVEAVEDPNTGEVARRSPAVIRRVIRPETSAIMRGIMTQVVRYGTAKSLSTCRYSIGGKTGTAQKRDADGQMSHTKFISSFVGFAPAEAPRICVLVMVDEPKGAYYGATVAAPAVGHIIEKTLAMLEATPTDAGPGSAVAAGYAAR